MNAGEQPHRSVREPFASCWVGFGLGSFGQHLNCYHVDVGPFSPRVDLVFTLVVNHSRAKHRASLFIMRDPPPE